MLNFSPKIRLGMLIKNVPGRKPICVGENKIFGLKVEAKAIENQVLEEFG